MCENREMPVIFLMEQQLKLMGMVPMTLDLFLSSPKVEK